ncbi:unnamed protein product [Euphydryas editha]|uniref:Arrestin C-terminal-like domain-containing protein n=1 Tax=Euphydryas editha TaxID=104508 RepID=A0AAU9TP32_EUPED|nr:unnamed protein product [Euphydryas editha]
MVWDTCKIVLHNRPDEIDLKVKGTSKAIWSRPSPTMPYIKIYSEKKEVFCVTVDIFRELQGKTIQQGTISRQFHFFLPPDLPPSYNDTIAKVHYRIKIQSKNGYGFIKKVVFPFRVINPVDLNHLDEYKIPMLYEMEKKSFCLLFKTYKGFTSGQLIPFEAIIKNKHKIKVKRIEVYLIQKIEYSIAEGFYNAEESLCKSVYSDVLSVVDQSCSFNMKIPQVMPSTMNLDNSMVNVSYALRVKVCFLFHFPLEIDIPVTIATVPLTYKV